MNLYVLKITLISSIIVLSACADIKFKLKTNSSALSEIAMSEQQVEEKEVAENFVPENESVSAFNRQDLKIIHLYYADNSNKVIIQGMIKQTSITKEKSDKLTAGSYIQNNIQVIPLPLELEKILSPLPRSILRIQVGRKIMLMNVNSRQILGVIIF